MLSKVKILIVGPSNSGKTVVSNFLADATDSTSGVYRPTQGVRILEYEIDNIEVALWDCSGSQKFEVRLFKLI